MIDIVSTAGPASEAPREPTRFVPVAGRDGQLPPIETTSASLSGIVFVIEGVTKFTAGAWVAIVLMGAITVTALRTRRYYVLTGQQLALRAEEAATPPRCPRSSLRGHLRADRVCISGVGLCRARTSRRRLSSSPLTRRAHRGWRADHRKGLDKALTKAAEVVKRTVGAATDEITSELQEALKS
jgi:hypothetical protein